MNLRLMESMAEYRGTTGFGIYIHVPFCISKCDYCDFYSIPVGLLDRGKGNFDKEIIANYLAAIRTEMQIRASCFEKRGSVRSIFFGGGTPSLLPSSVLSQIIRSIEELFEVDPDCEITVEGNPEQMDRDYLGSLHEIGVNRVNVGIQSFNFVYLSHFRRYYNAERYANILDELSASSIPHRGVDLIYGFPGQNGSDFEKDLQRAVNSSIDHISVYSLTMEEGSEYGRKFERGEAFLPDEEIQSSVFQALPALLKQYNYNHYEVSNFAREGGECRHNLSYWQYRPFLGLGPSAHGFDGIYRYENPSQLDLWMENPAGVTMKLHDPGMEIPIGILRITDGISLSYLAWLTQKYYDGREQILHSITEMFAGWIQSGLGTWKEPGLFQWEMEGLLFLDDRIFEMCQLMEKHRNYLIQEPY